MSIFDIPLKRAVERRWWLIITSIIENLFFSALIFGWPALAIMLKAEGYFAGDCADHHNETHHNDTHHNDTLYGNYSYAADEHSQDSIHRKLLSMGGGGDANDCGQGQTLNLLYTLCLFTMTGSTLLIGILQDKYGYKPVRLCAAIIFSLSAIMMMMATPENGAIVFPALVMNGLGGMAIAFTSFQIPNMFGPWRATMLACLSGSYNTAAMVFTVMMTPNLFGHLRATMLSFLAGSYNTAAMIFPMFMAMYDGGVPFRMLWLILAVGGGWVFLNALINLPSKTIPPPDDLKEELKRESFNADKESGEEYYKLMQGIGDRLSTGIVYQYRDVFTSRTDLTDIEGEAVEEEEIPPFRKVVCGPIFLLGLMFLSIMFLRVLLYMGVMDMHMMMITGGDEAKVAHYGLVFGMMQVLCFFACPVIGIMIDYGTRNLSVPGEKETKAEEQKRLFKLRIRKLTNCRNAFIMNSIILIVFGVAVLIPNMGVQLVSFFMHTFIRGSGMTAILGMFAVAFHFSYYGKLVGIQILMSAIVDLGQSPLFMVIAGPLEGNPFWVDIGLLIVSFLNFLLPLYLVVFIRRLQRAETELQQKLALAATPVTKKHMPPSGFERAISITKDGGKEFSV
ncbi:unnamed protein product [Owenia fusiformis]|uniref:Uncharacterized protein n=1 Tax=Owenia fusiformis TaxID=6347 RepID=A0A8S4QAK0_OWEFU|nr:unnamed protein product [Owenia fusiformis]